MTPRVRVELEDPAAPVAAGGTVRGVVRVEAAEPVRCRSLRVEVGWSTSGKGDRDESWHGEDLAGDGHLEPGTEHAFALEVPLGPLTYHGRLIKIDWAVRARIDRPWAFDAKDEARFTVIG